MTAATFAIGTGRSEVKPRGEMIDIGGRRLRVVRAGQRSPRPLIVLEHGAFGCATDWAVVQERLTTKGYESLAYDRAGMGHSEPGPTPRDGRAIVADLAGLLREIDEERRVVLVGHSMGGLMVRLFALTYPERVAGLVMVDAVTPDVLASPVGSRAVRLFDRTLRIVRHGAKLGLMRPVAALTGDRIGLGREASIEKRRIHGSATHAHWSAEEVGQWSRTSEQAAAEDFAANLPVAVIVAGGQDTPTALRRVQIVPAIASRNGYIEHVPKAGHANLLGRRFADPIIRGVDHVVASATS